MFEENKEEKEEWRIISENENYEVSRLGQIRNKKTKKILKKRILPSGYENVGLSAYPAKRKTYYIHRLVALAFIPNPNNFPQVNHKDRNKANNKVENLEWATRSMNQKHCVETGAKRYKRAVWRRDSESKKIEFDSIKEASRVTGYSTSTISDYIRGKYKTTDGCIWGYVKEIIKEKPREDIASFEIKKYPNYRIYNNGQIYSEKSKIYLKPSITNGYYRICLYNNNNKQYYNIHTLVAQYFCENPDNKPIVNHQDGNKLNNHYTNLEWVTYTENTQHAHDLGLNKTIKRVYQYTLEGEYLRTFNNCREAAEFVKFKSKTKTSIFSITNNIYRACRGERETAYRYRWEYEKIST